MILTTSLGEGLHVTILSAHTVVKGCRFISTTLPYRCYNPEEPWPAGEGGSDLRPASASEERARRQMQETKVCAAGGSDSTLKVGQQCGCGAARAGREEPQQYRTVERGPRKLLPCCPMAGMYYL